MGNYEEKITRDSQNRTSSKLKIGRRSMELRASPPAHGPGRRQIYRKAFTAAVSSSFTSKTV
jgi:hypothetical protein